MMETGKPSVPQIAPPKCADRPPAVYLRILTATVGLLIGLPVVYAILDSFSAQQNAVIHGLEVASGVLWGLAMIVFWAILLALKEYSPTLSAVLDGLGFVLEVLFLLLG